MKKLIRLIVSSNFIERFEALELFAREGNWHTIDYSDCMRTLDLWELDPAHEAALRKRFPFAAVKITDSFSEIQATSKKFDLVVSDNSRAVYGDHAYCEHFELFPNVFRILHDRSILILNVIPLIGEKHRKRSPYLFDDEHCRRRSTFYQTDCPKRIPIEDMLRIYREHAERNGFALEKHVIVKRTFVYYLALFLAKTVAVRNSSVRAGQEL